MMEGPAIVRAKSDRLWPGAQLFARLFVYQIPSRFPVFFFLVMIHQVGKRIKSYIIK